MAVNVAEIITEVVEKMRQNATSPTAIPRTWVLREVNNMLKDLTEHSYLFFKKDDDAISLLLDIRSYEQPTDCYELFRIFDDEEKTIYPVTIEQLEEENRDWVDDEGMPTHYMLGYESTTKLTFYPRPHTDEVGKKVGIQYRYYETALTDSTISYLPGPISNNKILATDYCLGHLLMARTEAQDQAVSQMHLNAYYTERKRWESRPKAPEKLRIMGIRGEQAQIIKGPGLPDNYPSTRLWR
jgi:hypothetical protein